MGKDLKTWQNVEKCIWDTEKKNQKPAFGFLPGGLEKSKDAHM